MNVTYLKWVPVVERARCTGCARCAEACSPKALELANRVAILALPDTCGSEEHCISPCPENAIQMQWLELDGERAVGKCRANVSIDPVPKATHQPRRMAWSVRRAHVSKVSVADHALSR